MSAEPARANSDQEELGPDVLVARQAVVDDGLRVCGYRVAYATDPGEPGSQQTDTRLFGDVMTVLGIEQLVGQNVAHLPVSRDLLLTLGIPPVRPDRVVLRLAYETAVDPQVQGIISSLASRGYSLAVEADPDRGFDLQLLELFGTVEIDFAAWEESQLGRLMPIILERHAIPLASGVLEHSDFDRARARGFEWFTGPFIASPRITPARSVPVGQLDALGALARLQGGTPEIEDLEAVINHDLGLSLKLLRYINSAYFGIRNDITSIRQAVMMLGSRGVSRWAMLVALTGGPAAPPELAMLALTRARMCEILGRARHDVDGEELFTVGMLSVSDALLGLPLDEIVECLPLAEEVVEALLHRAGPAGGILDAVLTYEQGKFDAAVVRANRRGISGAYVGALGWARGVLDEAA